VAMSEPAETRLDLRGLKCPLPTFKTRAALARLGPGDLLVVECTDPLAGIDIPHLLRETGDALEAQERQGAAFVFRIRKAPVRPGETAG
jgi:tRNA 2-thiouridine synthesizing protein A